MGVEGPKRQTYDKGKMRGRSSLASSCSSWAVSQKKELFLTDVSESAVISQCSIWQVLSLKLEGVEENQPCGVRNGVLQDLFFFFGAAPSGGGAVLEACILGNVSAGR